MVFDVFSRLNYRCYDFRRINRWPSRHYIIAACHRSGSTLLGLRLWETGIAGAPLEYFNELFDVRVLAARFDANTPEEYVSSLCQHRTSPNGVFGVKVQLPHWPATHAYRMMLAAHGSALRLIYTTRRDTLAQAVSLARAAQTQQWTSFAPTTQRPAYDSSRIKNSYLMIRHEERGWNEIFRALAISPLRVEYESIEADVDGVLQQVLAHIGIDDPGVGQTIDLPRLQRQRDAATESWMHRFQDEEGQWLSSIDETIAHRRQRESALGSHSPRPPLETA